MKARSAGLPAVLIALPLAERRRRIRGQQLALLAVASMRERLRAVGGTLTMYAPAWIVDGRPQRFQW